MAKPFDFQWQISVPDGLLQGGRFDRWEEVSHYTSAKEVIFSPVFVCLSVNKITQKLLIKSLSNFMDCLDIIQGPID